MVDGTSFLSMVVVAAFSSLVSSVVPLFWYRNGIKKRTLHTLLGVSAGILFALATIDLIPEGIAVSSVDAQREAAAQQLALRAKEHVHEEQPVARTSGAEGEQSGESRTREKSHNHQHDHGDGHSSSSSSGGDYAEYGRKITMIGVGLGFLSLVLLEHLMLSMGVEHTHGPDDDAGGKDMETGDGHSHAHAHGKKSSATGLSDSFSLTAFAAIAIHSLVDGVVIGGSFRGIASGDKFVVVVVVLL